MSNNSTEHTLQGNSVNSNTNIHHVKDNSGKNIHNEKMNEGQNVNIDSANKQKNEQHM